MMQFENTTAFASALDEHDKLSSLRDEFLIPEKNNRSLIYLCGNSLGLQPKSADKLLQDQLNNWQNLAVEGWFEGEEPWMFYHKELKKMLAPIVGAQVDEVTPMNTLSVNLHLMMVTFYQPKGKRTKILMEGGAFPSDQYAVESQIRFHGLDPEENVIEIHPRKGEYVLRTEDITARIDENKDELALILFGGINYYTGQLFDMRTITEAGHKAGCIVGFDLAHAAGNVPLELHNWNVDFACWCSYKYMNSSPGGISGVFVHQKHFNTDLPRFAGWWGYDEDQRFKMTKGFVPEKGAEGWQLSCSPVMLMALHKAALLQFEKAGGITALREKSRVLTAYLEFLIGKVNEQLGKEHFKIITPKNPDERGAQLSIICAAKGKLIFDELVNNNVLGDWREPDVIRLSPVPMYNTFSEVYQTGKLLSEISAKLKI